MATDRIVSLFDTPLAPRFRRVERIREWEALSDRLDEGDKDTCLTASWPHDSGGNRNSPDITDAQIARLRFELLVAGTHN